jgi:hypothetical protein
MRKLYRVYSLLAVAAVSLVVTAIASASAAYPLAGVGTGFTDQLTNAVTTALPIAGPIIALFVGWKVFKRLVRG